MSGFPVLLLDSPMSEEDEEESAVGERGSTEKEGGREEPCSARVRVEGSLFAAEAGYDLERGEIVLFREDARLSRVSVV